MSGAIGAAALVILAFLWWMVWGRKMVWWDRFMEFIGPYLDRSVWFRSVPVLAPALSAAAFGIAVNVHEKAVWWWNGAGVTLIVATTIVESLRESYRSRLRKADNLAAAGLVVSLRNALRPMAESIADMQSLPKEKRRERADAIGQRCAEQMVLVMKHVPDFRSVVYCKEGENRLRVLAWAGRSGTPPPLPFTIDDVRGQAAFATINGKVPIFVRDVNDAVEVKKLQTDLPGVVYEGPREGYRTFIAAPVVGGEHDYGMITADAANPGDLLPSEKFLVGLVADMLAIAFASIR